MAPFEFLLSQGQFSHRRTLWHRLRVQSCFLDVADPFSGTVFELRGVILGRQGRNAGQQQRNYTDY